MARQGDLHRVKGLIVVRGTLAKKMHQQPTLFLLFYPQAFRPYKLALVSREDDGHRRDSSAVAPARLTLTLLALEPGQVVAAQAQLAVALEDTGSRILRQEKNGMRCTE